MGKTYSIRMPDTMVEKLEQLSKELNRNKAFIIKSALLKYFDEYSDYQIALDRLKNKDDKLVTPEEMRALLDIQNPV